MGYRIIFAVLMLATSLASGQWNPQAGHWGKSDERHIRVMTWNVQDRLCSSNTKAENGGTWHGMAIVIASLEPDVLILQETGDNSGNGTGSGVDSVANLQTVARLLFEGGADPFRGGTVGAYVQKYAPGYNLPYRFASTVTDGFNRNLILSRFPFTDLNGDGVATISNIPNVNGDGFSAGGNGGIRGFQFAEIDLPDDVYLGDLVVGNAHLKCCGDASSRTQRENAARNVGYYIYYLFGGGGTNTPDPNNAIGDNPPATHVLDQFTPVIFGGDLNEDELTNGRRGPAAFLTEGGMQGGDDGTDRDSSDSAYDSATDLFSGSRVTQNSGSKLDYIAWWDSTATSVRQFLFNSSTIPAVARPPEFAFHPSPQAISSVSDHRPVIVDFALPVIPIPPAGFSLLSPAAGQMSTPIQPLFQWEASERASSYQLLIATDSSLSQAVITFDDLPATSYLVPANTLNYSTQYYWGVVAANADGTTASSPVSRSFTTEVIPVPGIFALTSPASNAQGVALYPTFTWNTSPRASTYRLTLASNSSFANIERVINNINATQHTLIGEPLQPCGQFFWKVEAINSSGTTTSIPSFRTFQVGNPFDIADDFGFTADQGGGPDGTVDFGDFVALLGLLGPCPGGTPGCLGDFADDFGFVGPDGVVDFGDFVALLGVVGLSCD